MPGGIAGSPCLQGSHIQRSGPPGWVFGMGLIAPTPKNPVVRKSKEGCGPCQRWWWVVQYSKWISDFVLWFQDFFTEEACIYEFCLLLAHHTILCCRRHPWFWLHSYCKTFLQLTFISYMHKTYYIFGTCYYEHVWIHISWIVFPLYRMHYCSSN